jgi:type IV pilus assembly protein PilC
MITVFLTFFIFPKILPIVQGLKTQLPFSTKLLLKITTVVTRQWRFLLFFSLVGVSGCIWITKIKQVRFFLEKILLQLPPFSLLYKKYAISIFSRTLLVQLERGVRIVTALDLTRTTVPGVLYKKSLNDICEKIKLGQKFSTALISEKTLFPPIVSQMIAAGETTGTLSKNLQTLADMYESDLDTLTKNLTVLIEPVLMICMGCVVGFIALAIITPIYAVTQNLNTN